jgi:hypothetical protein
MSIEKMLKRGKIIEQQLIKAKREITNIARSTRISIDLQNWELVKTEPIMLRSDD